MTGSYKCGRISIGDFIRLLKDSYDMEDVSFESFRKRGWIEEEAEEMLDRRTAARLIHLFMRDMLGIEDIRNINEAYKLKDLFDCRVCAGHIAQVYLRGIIDAEMIGDMYIFDSFRGVTSEEALGWIKMIKREEKNGKA